MCTYVKSATRSRSGAAALNLRRTLSRGQGRAGDRGFLASPGNPLQALLPHEPLHGASGPPALRPTQLAPSLVRSVPSCAFGVDAPDRLEGFGVAFGPVGGFARIAGDGGMRVIGRRSDLQDATDRLDSVGLTMLFNERDHLRNGRSSSAWMRHWRSVKREHLSFSAIEAQAALSLE